MIGHFRSEHSTPPTTMKQQYRWLAVILMAQCASPLDIISRRHMIASSTIVGVSSGPWGSKAWAAGNSPREAVLQAATRIPGYGQPDIFLPSYFEGKWNCERELVSVSQDLPDPSTSSYFEDAQFFLEKPLTYRVRFITYDGKIVADRSYNELNLEKASFVKAEELGRKTARTATEASWDPANANIITTKFSDGFVRESKVPPTLSSSRWSGSLSHIFLL